MKRIQSSKLWNEVFLSELDTIRSRRRARGQSTAGEHAEAGMDDRVGLAFSGGGIRSATFGLGVLEALKEFGLLGKIDYLSTVSGGGYIGAWLSANCKRAARRGEDWLDRNTDWSGSVAHLRRYSNYLSPEVGFFSADTWSMFTVWFRNALLVQLTVIAAVACVLLLPRLLVAGFAAWPSVGNWRWVGVALFTLGVVGIAGNQRRVSSHRNVWLLQRKHWPIGLVLAAACGAAAWAFARWMAFDPFRGGRVDHVPAAFVALLLVGGGFCLLPVGVRLVAGWKPNHDAPTQINYSQAWVQLAVVIPILTAGFFLGAILWGETVGGGELSRIESYGDLFMTAWHYWPFPLSVVFFSVWLLSFCSAHDFTDLKAIVVAALAPVVCVVVLHALLCVIMLLLHQWKPAGLSHAFVWAPPLVLFAFALTVVALIGMMGRQSTEGVREWWSRFGAWLSIYGTAWMVIAVAAVYTPGWVYAMIEKYPSTSLSTVGGWIGTVIAGLVAGRSDSTGGSKPTGKTNALMQIVALVAPFVFIAGLLIAIATGLDLLVTYNANSLTWWNIGARGRDSDALQKGFQPFLNVSLATLAACFAALLVLAFRVDINEFSLNAFYRSRLVRCYLGATRFGKKDKRVPQNFTGFDDHDDIALASLADSTRAGNGPLHIVNCALNLGGSGDLSLHTRHSASFTLTPLHCGSSYPAQTRPDSDEQMRPDSDEQIGFVPTHEYGGRFGATTLGQAISVSGAAASPNMGYHTSPVVAFLLTIFNVRLGWWFPNPSLPAKKFPSPRFNLRYMLAELFGGATDKSSFLMISDGGHFENLAVYELVKRKCRVIIVSDSECDPGLNFEGLGALIRMCQVDFGARIRIDVASIRPVAGSSWSSNRCAVGEISYADGLKGVLIYLKASMTGHEDTSILQYRASHPKFPHETTGDQFYGEDQFESYRALGSEMVRRALATAIDERDRGADHDMVMLADRLRNSCSPTADRIGRFTGHTERLMKLWERLGSNQELRGLDPDVLGASFPLEAPAATRFQIYICAEMIQLMENVYIDLNLEETWDHPDNKGWQVMFGKWAASPQIRATWTSMSTIFGIRFQYFCERRLGLPVPAAHASPYADWSAIG